MGNNIHYPLTCFYTCFWAARVTISGTFTFIEMAPISEMDALIKHREKVMFMPPQKPSFLAFSLPKMISSVTHIGNMTDLMPSQTDVGFRKWAENSMTNLYQLQKKGSFKSFEHLKEEFALPNTDFSQYLQLRSFLLKHKDCNRAVKSCEAHFN